jgi:hypothetical protein
MKLDVLMKTFTKQDKPGLDSLDPRLGDVAALAQAGKFAECATQSQKLLEEEVYDVRLIGYLCFGVFIEVGVTSLADIMRGLTNTVTTNWEAVGPGPQRVQATQTSLGFFFKQLTRQLTREQKLNSAEYKDWIEKATFDGVTETLTGVADLKKALEGVLGSEDSKPLVEVISKVREFLQAFQPLVKKPQAPDAPAAPVEDADGKTSGARPSGAGVAIEGSHHLRILLRKIEVFEQLIAEKKFPRAQIVAADITQILTSFDPVLYLPAVFTTFLKLMAMHVGDLLQHEAARETPPGKALQQLYRVDIDAFVAL